MKKKLFFSVLLVCLLAFVSCDNGTNDNGGTNLLTDGTWAKGTDRLVISGTNYTFRQETGGTLYDVSKGTVTADLSATSGVFTINQTHEINSSTGQLEPNPVTAIGTFSVTGNTMILGGFTGTFSLVNGTWTK